MLQDSISRVYNLTSGVTGYIENLDTFIYK